MFKGVGVAYPIAKRALDFVVALIVLVALAPLLAAVAAAVRFDSSGPALFRQERVGRNGERFTILKFRTMCTNAPKDTPTHLMAGTADHITNFGAFLRRSSLDELPQLLNILAGSMSFVGPRPALWNQYDLIEEREKYGANGVRPGLTGLAQVSGRDELPIAVKAALDGEYVRKLGPAMDLRCILATFGVVATSAGVVEGDPDARDTP